MAGRIGLHRKVVVPARQFRPVPKVDGGVLVAARRDLALRPTAMAGDFADFVRARWTFPKSGRTGWSREP